MATRGVGDDGQITGAHGDSNVGQVNGVCGEWDQNYNHPTTDGGVQWWWHRMTMHQSNQEVKSWGGRDDDKIIA